MPVSITLEGHLDAIGGFGINWILFGGIGLYLILRRPKQLINTLFHPVFLMAYALLYAAFLIELSHANAMFREILQIGQMFVGAVFVATLCRDKLALRRALYGYLIADN